MSEVDLLGTHEEEFLLITGSLRILVPFLKDFDRVTSHMHYTYIHDICILYISIEFKFHLKVNV